MGMPLAARQYWRNIHSHRSHIDATRQIIDTATSSGDVRNLKYTFDVGASFGVAHCHFMATLAAYHHIILVTSRWEGDRDSGGISSADDDICSSPVV